MPDSPGSASQAASAASRAGEASPSPRAGGDEGQDLALVRSITAGEAGAWRLLLGRHQANVYNLCLKLVGNKDLAEDLAQDTLVKIVQHIARFDGRARFSTWLYRITMNVCLSRLRAEKVRRHSSLDEQAGEGAPSHASLIPGREPGAWSSVESSERSRHVLLALECLEPEQRAILVLRDTRDLDYEQIAEILDVPVGTVKSRLFRARAALRTALEQHESGDGPSEGPEVL